MERVLKLGKYKISGYMLALLGFWIVLAVLNVMAPASQAIARYGISTIEGNLIRAAVLVPSLFIWVTALYAVLRFYNYNSYLRGSAEGTGFKRIAFGLQLLFLGLIIPNVLNLINAYNPDNAEVLRAITITRNYMTLGFYFAAFWNIYQGIKNLNMSVPNNDQLEKQDYRTLIISMALLSFAYVWGIFHNDSRLVAVNTASAATYYLEDWLIVLTILIPYLITWTIGGLALIQIRRFAKNVNGSVYKKAFKSAMYGLFVIILLSIGLQLLAQGATALGGAALQTILLLVFLILIVMGFGYLLLAKGARELTAIEEV